MSIPNASGGPSAIVKVKLQGSECSLDVRSATVEDNDRLIDKAVIVVSDPNGQYKDMSKEEQSLTVEMGWEGNTGVLFEGVVTQVTPGTGQTTLTAFDLSYKLMTTEARGCTHTGRLSEILKKIVKSHGLTVGQIEPDPDPEFSKSKQLNQAGKTDWQLIQDLTLAFGGRAFVEYNDDKSRFYFVSEKALMSGKSQGVLRKCRGFSHLKEFEMERVAARAAMQRTAATFDKKTGEVVGNTEPIPVPPDDAPEPDPEKVKQISEDLGTSAANRYLLSAELAAKADSTPANQRPRAVASGLATDPHLVAELIRRDPTRLSGLLARGVANGNIGLRAKGKVTVEGTGSWSDGDWYVHKAVHSYGSSQGDPTYTTSFVVTR